MNLKILILLKKGKRYFLFGRKTKKVLWSHFLDSISLDCVTGKTKVCVASCVFVKDHFHNPKSDSVVRQ